MYVVMNEEYISHHGVKGQRWGRRNGPPYPLSRQGSEANQRFKKQYAENRKKSSSGGGSTTVTTEYSGKKDSTTNYISKSIRKIITSKQAEKFTNKVQKRIQKDEAKKDKQAAKAKSDMQKLKETDPDAYEKEKQKALKEGSADDVLKFKGDLTNQQLQDASTRLSWESKLTEQSLKERNANWDRLNNTMKKIGDVANWAESTYKLINAGNNIINTINKFTNNDSSQSAPKQIKMPEPKTKQEKPKQEKPKQEKQMQPKQEPKVNAKEVFNKGFEEYKKKMESDKGWSVEGEGTSTAKRDARTTVDAEWKELSFLPAVINNSYKSSRDNTIEGIFRDISSESSNNSMNNALKQISSSQPSQILMLEDKRRK